MKVCGKVLFDLMVEFMPAVESGIASRLQIEKLLDITWILFVTASFVLFGHVYFKRLIADSWRSKELVSMIPLSLMIESKDLTRRIEIDITQF